jgi:hypothetical protein
MLHILLEVQKVERVFASGLFPVDSLTLTPTMEG